MKSIDLKILTSFTMLGLTQWIGSTHLRNSSSDIGNLKRTFILVLSHCMMFSTASFRIPFTPDSSSLKKALTRLSSSSLSRRCLSSYQAHSMLHEEYDTINELPESFPRRHDVAVALSAVRQACMMTRKLQPTKQKMENTQNVTGSTSYDVITRIDTVEKSDLSPVTVADFASQALILNHLHNQFPDDGFIAEEDSSSLRADDDLCRKVMDASSLSSVETVLQSIDLGKSYLAWDTDSDLVTKPTRKRPDRVWSLDPIDGTRGFLRGQRAGGQYCIALALLEHGIPVVGILGCPNLPCIVGDNNYSWEPEESFENNRATRGCIFVASKGGGCFQIPLVPNEQSSEPAWQKLRVTPSDGSKLSVKNGRFCIGVEKYSDALGQCAGIAKFIHGGERALDNITGDIINARRMDSQAKHGCIARGEAEFYVRLPDPSYNEWIWDHAAGKVVIEEAGGEITDTEGNALDFSLGAQLSPCVRGVLMSNGGAFHEELLKAMSSTKISI